jgi:hypothetical protein
MALALSNLFLGELLGKGIARKVYALRPWPAEYVVKVQTRQSFEEGDYQNIAEWELWSHADPKLRRWLAPCISLSPCGRALIQVRTETIYRAAIPKRVPAVLGDLHQDNFGHYKGKVVLRDYGRHLAYKLSANAKTMRDANAYDHT